MGPSPISIEYSPVSDPTNVKTFNTFANKPTTPDVLVGCLGDHGVDLTLDFIESTVLGTSGIFLRLISFRRLQDCSKNKRCFSHGKE